MAAVTETLPGTQPSINQKSDVQSVPSGEDDSWVDAADMNDLGQSVVVLARNLRNYADVAAIAQGGANEGLAFRFTGLNANGLGETDTTLATALNKAWAAAVEKIEQGGDVNGTASNANFMGVKRGLISGTFTTGTLYGLSGGLLATYAGGKHPPVAIGLTTSMAYLDIGGRVMADNVFTRFTTSGTLENISKYGEMFCSAAGTSQTLSNVYVTINQMIETGLSNGVSVSAGNLMTAITAGSYYVHVHMSLQIAVAETYLLAVHVNGAEQVNSRQYGRYNDNDDRANVPLSCILALSANDKVDVRAKGGGAGKAFRVIAGNFSMHRV